MLKRPTRQQTQSRQAFGNLLARRWRDTDSFFALATGIFVAKVLDELPAGRLELQLFTAIRADLFTLAASAWARHFRVGQIVLDDLPRQMIGQCLAASTATFIRLNVH